MLLLCKTAESEHLGEKKTMITKQAVGEEYGYLDQSDKIIMVKDRFSKL